MITLEPYDRGWPRGAGAMALLLLLLALASCSAPLTPERAIARLEKKPGEPFASVVRSVDASSYRRRVVMVSARLKSEGIAKGANGVWLRADGSDRKLLGFANSYGSPVTGESGWVERRAALEIDAGADRIVFGAMNDAPGALLVDDLRIQAVDEHAAQAPSAAAAGYLRDVLDKVRALAYYSDRVDWRRAQSMALVLASGAQTTGDTYEAIRYVLGLLGDHHSHLIDPADVRAQRSSTARDFKVTGAVWKGVGYMALPGYNGQNVERSQAFSSAVQRYITDAQALHICHWIVDLRDDTGGNMYPMLAGLQPLLGEQPLGYFRNRGGEWHPWFAGHGGTTRDVSRDPVALITGRKTASAGEAVTLSFRGRPRTRSFGEPTAGYSTANQPITLADGAVIALTTGLMADRNRRVAVGSIPPDETTVVPETVQLDQDPAIRAAAEWLENQPCASSSGQRAE